MEQIPEKQKRVCISLPFFQVADIDSKRGSVARSRFIADLLEEILEKNDPSEKESEKK